MNKAFMGTLTVFLLLPVWVQVAEAVEKPTYAEKLGWPAGSKVVIFHVDDAGMCPDSNAGAIEAIEQGVATSTSVMMPCPAVPEFLAYVKDHPALDVGVHATLTSEWKTYRWGPVADKASVPGLVDPEGYMWRGVVEVCTHATADEFETELRAQVQRALDMGLKPTHIDSHMGTVFYPPFLERYMKVGREMGIPVMMFGGHYQHIDSSVSILRWYARKSAERLWDAGLPVLDDVILDPTENAPTYEARRAKLIDVLHTMKPGITQFIVHCTKTSEDFKQISGSGPKRLAELRLMLDPEVKQVIEQDGIILTTWRELKERRDRIGTQPAPATATP